MSSPSGGRGATQTLSHSVSDQTSRDATDWSRGCLGLNRSGTPTDILPPPDSKLSVRTVHGLFGSWTLLRRLTLRDRRGGKWSHASFPAHTWADLRGAGRLKEAKIGAFLDADTRSRLQLTRLFFTLTRGGYICRCVQGSVSPSIVSLSLT